jgi:hypothetical protein
VQVIRAEKNLQVKILSYMIQVGHELYKMKNLESMIAMIRGIAQFQKYEIWDELDYLLIAQFEEMWILQNCERSFQNLRQCSMGLHPPIVPFLSKFLFQFT